MKTLKILVATDFSDEAYNALFYATKLLANQSCIFFILHVFKKPIGLLPKQINVNDKKIDLLEKESIENLKKTFHKIHLDDKNELHEFKMLSKQGFLGEVIYETIGNFCIDIVFMGNKGTTGAKEIFMGSNTVQTIRDLRKCPLMAVPKEVEFKLPKKIAFISDLKKGCNLKTIKPLLHLVKMLDASVHIVHIIEEEFLSSLQASNKKLLQISFNDFNPSFTSIFEFADKAQIIDSFVKNSEVDIFSMVHTKKSLIERLLKKPVLLDLSIYSTVPFLMLPHRE
ncbi:universal stress protein [Maribacter aurantiacus]|uniref:Universal stress protein n=1 Tax=Maribacter aurantiacus TaxID=1882343 RepID=A0A5R8MBY5_9FLAO|nr:universal stress protein [Maribacter aurantiacus]TLF47081.1 universal stress protein [Maribacter aurantiacus]